MADKQIIDAMWDDSPVDVSTEVNFIWSIANKLRGPYRSDKYKDVIIPMTIIRRFECALAPTKQRVVDQFKANPNFPAKAMYRISGFQFYNTSEFDLAELVNDADHKATNFVQKKAEEHTTPNLVAQPVVKLPTAESFGLTEAKEERLSQIIAEINSRTGKAYDNDVAVKAMLQIRDILLKSDKLKTSARNNTVKDFEFSYFDDIDDALIEGLEQNQDFFSLLLSNDEIKRQVLGIFTDEIYKSLREA